VARVGEEAARIRHHADEAREQTHVRQHAELRFHAVELIEEPPRGAPLHLSGHSAGLIVADDGREHGIVGGVGVVEDRLGELVGGVERIEEAGQGTGVIEIADGVEAGVGSQQAAHASVGVAQRAQVKLLNPAAGVIEQRHVIQQRGAEGFGVVGAEGSAGAQEGESGVHGSVAEGRGMHAVQAVVGGSAAQFVEGRVAGFQGRHERAPVANRNVGSLLQLVDPGVPGREVVDGEGFIGTPRGIDSRVGIRARGELAVVFEAGYAEDARSGEFEEGRRGWKKCACSIHVSGSIAGTFKRRNTGKSDWDEAKAVASAWEASGRWAGVPAQPLPVVPEVLGGITVERAVSVFLAEHSAAVNTQKKYRLLLKKLTSYTESKGYVLIEQWSPLDVREFRASWKVSPITASKNLTLIKSFFEFAVSNEWIARNPARLVKEARGQAVTKERIPFSDDELKRMFEARASDHGPLIFGGHTTRDMSVITDLWRRKLKRLWDLCGSWPEKPTPHRFRHTFARILLQRANVTVRDVAELLGDTEDMVRRHYAAWVPERQARLTKMPLPTSRG